MKNLTEIDTEYKSNDQLTNLDMLKSFTNNNESLIKKTLNAIINEIPKDIATIGEAINENNLDIVKAVAHRSKPNFKLVASEVICNLIVRIEQLASQKIETKEIERLFNELKYLRDPLLTELKEKYDELN